MSIAYGRPYLLSLPEDILIPMFLASIDSGHSYQYTFPIRLSHISSYLRHIVLNAPLMWATIDDQALRFSDLLDIFLERSQSCGLTITIKLYHSLKIMHNFGKVV